MAEEFTPQEEITQDDKLWAAIGYPIPILPILVLVMEEKKNRPFLRYHAIQSLIFNVVLWIVTTVLGTVTCGIGLIIWLVILWPAWEAYQGKYLVIPVITNFMKSQKWV
jgi:uncharacterized membrane protein